MTSSELIQIAAGLIGSLCFGILFNMRGKRLIAAAVGGLLSWGLFVVLSNFVSSEPINYFIVAAVVSLYSEIMARALKTPAAPVVTTSLIPLIPGGSLYYTMASAFESNFTTFLEKAVSTLKLACALALGIIVVTAISQFMFSRVKQK
ncbi:MAG: threonine/serine exporter family protein [Oscillospiraceae bacterium]|nr:threonine/serine exporter family protein [Oscillospiraceae bacterium]